MAYPDRQHDTTRPDVVTKPLADVL